MRQTNVPQIIGEKESVVASHEGHLSYKAVTFMDLIQDFIQIGTEYYADAAVISRK